MVFLGSFSSFLPARIVTNEELAPRLGVAPEWIAAASGVKERRFAAENESVSDLAFGAAR